MERSSREVSVWRSIAELLWDMTAKLVLIAMHFAGAFAAIYLAIKIHGNFSVLFVALGAGLFLLACFEFSQPEAKVPGWLEKLATTVGVILALCGGILYLVVSSWIDSGWHFALIPVIAGAMAVLIAPKLLGAERALAKRLKY